MLPGETSASVNEPNKPDLPERKSAGKLEIGQTREIPLEERLRKKSPQFDKDLHETLVTYVQKRHHVSKLKMDESKDDWKNAEERKRMYRPEDQDDQAAKQASRPAKFVVPISAIVDYPALMYLMNVFCSRQPVFEMVAQEGTPTTAAHISELLLHSQYQYNQGPLIFYNWFNAARTYGAGFVKDLWGQRREIGEVEQTSSVMQFSPTPPFVQFVTQTQFVEQEVVEYEGNLLNYVHIRNVYPDPRVCLTNFQDGEFFIEELRRAYSYLLWKQHEGVYFNIEPTEDNSQAWVSPGVGEGNKRSPTDVGKVDDKDTGFGRLWECWLKLIPEELDLGKGDLPELWVITVLNKKTIIRCERAVMGMRKFPYQLIQDQPLMHDFITPGTPETLRGIEAVIEWLINTDYRSICKSITGNTYFKPAFLLNPAQMNNAEGGLMIAVSKEAPSVDAAVVRHEIPYLTTHYQDMAVALMTVVEKLAGTNENLQGSVAKHSRTATEVAKTSQSAMGRLQMTATLYATQGTIPLSQMMMANQQRFDPVEQRRQMIRGKFDYPILEGTIFQKDDVLNKLLQFAQICASVGRPMNPDELIKGAGDALDIKNWKDMVPPQGPPMNPAQVQVMPDQHVLNQVKQGNLVPAGNLTPEAHQSGIRG